MYGCFFVFSSLCRSVTAAVTDAKLGAYRRAFAFVFGSIGISSGRIFPAPSASTADEIVSRSTAAFVL